MRLGLLETIVGRFADGQPIGNVSFENQQVQSIQDHVSRLLNSRRGMVPYLPDYGLPDIQEMYQAAPNSVTFLGKEIKATLERYEPRLRRVEVIAQPSTSEDFRISFLIRGEVARGSRVRFFTVFTPAGNARVGSNPEMTGD